MSSSKSKSKSKAKGKRKSSTQDRELIVIDEKQGLIFEDEDSLYAYFEPTINHFEKFYQDHRSSEDFTDSEQLQLEAYLDSLLERPDQIWLDERTNPEIPLHIFIRHFEDQNLGHFDYIAVVYVSTEDESPTFVLTHLPTRDPRLKALFQTGALLWDHRFEEVEPGSLDGDALGEGEPLALGLYMAMLKLRSEKDIPQEKFREYSKLREECIAEPDEIWRKIDSEGRGLVTFIKEFHDYEGTRDLTYVAVTLEDPQSGVHSLLFSFPTTDQSLVDRYRQGENLQADEVASESPH
ncbi:MAG: PBECR2 nuclease fold domain-containing protein [Bdellovibrionaceae bacterium]|nr:PBECR2 nuclease fold domain-containing protein [Pseudobdellovibrionaceae bacterium]